MFHTLMDLNRINHSPNMVEDARPVLEKYVKNLHLKLFTHAIRRKANTCHAVTYISDEALLFLPVR